MVDTKWCPQHSHRVPKTHRVNAVGDAALLWTTTFKSQPDSGEQSHVGDMLCIFGTPTWSVLRLPVDTTLSHSIPVAKFERYKYNIYVSPCDT